MQIVATHRERRRDDGTLSIEAVLLLGDQEYVLERNCASRKVAQHIADEEVRLIRRLILARLRQLHTEKRPAGQPMQPPAASVSEQREQSKSLVMPSLTGGNPIPLPGLEPYRKGPISPVPSGTNSTHKLNGKTPRPNTISAADL